MTNWQARASSDPTKSAAERLRKGLRLTGSDNALEFRNIRKWIGRLDERTLSKNVKCHDQKINLKLAEGKIRERYPRFTKGKIALCMEKLIDTHDQRLERAVKNKDSHKSHFGEIEFTDEDLGSGTDSDIGEQTIVVQRTANKTEAAPLVERMVHNLASFSQNPAPNPIFAPGRGRKSSMTTRILARRTASEVDKENNFNQPISAPTSSSIEAGSSRRSVYSRLRYYVPRASDHASQASSSRQIQKPQPQLAPITLTSPPQALTPAFHATHLTAPPLRPVPTNGEDGPRAVEIFLSKCFPSMEHLLPLFLDHGCRSQEHMLGIHGWNDKDKIFAYLEDMALWASKSNHAPKMTRTEIALLSQHFMEYFEGDNPWLH